MYGSRQAFGRRDQKLWEGEYEALAHYLESTWDQGLLEFGIRKPQCENMTLEELWETARHINAVALAEDLLDPSEENPVESPLVQQTVNRVLDHRGEKELLFDLEKLPEGLGLEKKEAVRGLMALVAMAIRDPSDDKAGRLARRIVEGLPNGVGEVHLVDQAVPFRDSVRLDLKTAIKLAINRCRIDR